GRQHSISTEHSRHTACAVAVPLVWRRHTPCAYYFASPHGAFSGCFSGGGGAFSGGFAGASRHFWISISWRSFSNFSPNSSLFWSRLVMRYAVPRLTTRRSHCSASNSIALSAGVLSSRAVTNPVFASPACGATITVRSYLSAIFATT